MLCFRHAFFFPRYDAGCACALIDLPSNGSARMLRASIRAPISVIRHSCIQPRNIFHTIFISDLINVLTRTSCAHIINLAIEAFENSIILLFLPTRRWLISRSLISIQYFYKYFRRQFWVSVGEAAIAINDAKLIHLECKLQLMLILDDVSCDNVSYTLIPLRSFRTYGIKGWYMRMLCGLFYCIDMLYRQTKQLVIYCAIQLQLYYGKKMLTNLLRRFKNFSNCVSWNEGPTIFHHHGLSYYQNCLIMLSLTSPCMLEACTHGLDQLKG